MSANFAAAKDPSSRRSPDDRICATEGRRPSIACRRFALIFCSSPKFWRPPPLLFVQVDDGPALAPPAPRATASAARGLLLAQALPKLLVLEH